jgi:hypothetical protein
MGRITDYFVHPELQENEVFFTNASSKQFAELRWTTKRQGKIAYDGNGKKITASNWFPVFLKRNELVKSKKTLPKLRIEFRKGLFRS